MKKLLTILILLCSLSSFGQFGMFQAHNRYSITQIKYGYLYNLDAATDARNIANEEWHVPTRNDFDTLISYVGGSSVAGRELKEEGTTYWSVSGGFNTYEFNARGGGQRVSGTFSAILTTGTFWTSTITTPGFARFVGMTSGNNSVSEGGAGRNEGKSLRLIKDSTTLSDGEFGTYTGNDGKVYRTICIGTQEWVADNIAETKYRNGDLIPEVTDGTTWSGLTTGARCVYDNDENNR